MLICPQGKISSVQIENRRPEQCQPEELIRACRGQEQCEVLPDCAEWDLGVTYRCDESPYTGYENLVKRKKDPIPYKFSITLWRSRIHASLYQHWLIWILAMIIGGIIYYLYGHLMHRKLHRLHQVVSSKLPKRKK